MKQHAESPEITRDLLASMLEHCAICEDFDARHRAAAVVLRKSFTSAGQRSRRSRGINSNGSPPTPSPHSSATITDRFVTSLPPAADWHTTQRELVGNLITYEQTIRSFALREPTPTGSVNQLDYQKSHDIVEISNALAASLNESSAGEARLAAVNRFNTLIYLSLCAVLLNTGRISGDGVDIMLTRVNSLERWSRQRYVTGALRVNKAIAELGQQPGWDKYRATEAFFLSIALFEQHEPKCILSRLQNHYRRRLCCA